MSSGWLYYFCKFYVRKKEGFSYEFGKNGERWLLKKPEPLDFKTVFDVGANVGGWSRQAAGHFRNARIHAFENYIAVRKDDRDLIKLISA